jgi:hypothetical protein
VEFRRGHANSAALEAGSNDSQDWVESSPFCFLQTYGTNAQTQRREALGQVQDAVVSHRLIGDPELRVNWRKILVSYRQVRRR